MGYRQGVAVWLVMKIITKIIIFLENSWSDKFGIFLCDVFIDKLMTIDVDGNSFDGPHPSPDHLDDESGVYTIHDNRDGKYRLIDVGESDEVKSRVNDHDRSDCWDRESTGTLTYSALYVDEQERIRIANEIRQQYNPPCGER